MSQVDVERFRTLVRARLAKYESELKLSERKLANQHSANPEHFDGKGRANALEAHVRVTVLDPLMRELGWNPAEPTVMAVEDAAEPAAGRGDRRRFLDYHGREVTALEANKSFLIVEAKRPSKKLPDPGNVSNSAQEITDLLNQHRTSPLDREIDNWPGWIASLCDYYDRTCETYIRAPKRVVITNGEWFVVFDGDPTAGSFRIFSDLADVAERAGEFFDLLSYPALTGKLPPQHPGALADFVSPGAEATCCLAAEVSYSKHGLNQPVLSVRVCAWVRADSGVWVQFRKTYSEAFLQLRSDLTENAKSIAEIQKRSRELIDDFRKTHPVKLIDASTFANLAKADGFRGWVGREERPPLLREIETDLYLLGTGSEAAYLVQEAAYDGCQYHHWGNAFKSGDAEGTSAITSPTIVPRAFFPSGSAFHCAHAGIHAKRRDKCVLAPFETFQCCRRCSFFAWCWGDDAELPCELNGRASSR